MASEAIEERPGSDTAPTRTRQGKIRLRTLDDLDGRTAAFHRFKALIAGYTADLGGNVSTAQESIVRRAVAIQVWCEDAEAGFASTGDFDIQAFNTSTNTLRRLLADLRLERRASQGGAH